jgi:hypothetical protein
MRSPDESQAILQIHRQFVAYDVGKLDIALRAILELPQRTKEAIRGTLIKTIAN